MLLKILVLLSKYCSTTALVQQLIHSNHFYELAVLIACSMRNVFCDL